LYIFFFFFFGWPLARPADPYGGVDRPDLSEPSSVLPLPAELGVGYGKVFDTNKGLYRLSLLVIAAAVRAAVSLRVN
jgi:hypothetical protein